MPKCIGFRLFFIVFLLSTITNRINPENTFYWGQELPLNGSVYKTIYQKICKDILPHIDYAQFKQDSRLSVIELAKIHLYFRGFHNFYVLWGSIMQFHDHSINNVMAKGRMQKHVKWLNWMQCNKEMNFCSNVWYKSEDWHRCCSSYEIQMNWSDFRSAQWSLHCTQAAAQGLSQTVW